MRLIQSFLSFWRNYTNFRGRATRGQFWSWQIWQTLFLLIFLIPTIYSSADFLSSIDDNHAAPSIGTLAALASAILPLLVLLVGYTVIALLPTLSLCVRRLHDANRSAGWLILNVGIDLALLTMYIITRTLNTDLALIFASAAATVFVLFAIGFVYQLCLPSEVEHNRYFLNQNTPTVATLDL